MRVWIGAAVFALLATAGGVAAGSPAPRAGLIVFASDRAEDSSAQIYAAPAAGGKRRNISRTPNIVNAAPVPSPDGSRLLFVADPTSAAAVSVSRVDGSGRRRLAFGNEPSWSPDGKRVVFVAESPDYGLPYALATIGVDGRGRRTLRGGLVQGPAWSPDGRQIAYVVRAVGPHGRQRELHVIDADGTNERRLGGPLALADGPSWSRDGKLALGTAPADEFGNPTATYGVHVFDPATGAEQVLPVPPPKVRRDTKAYLVHAVLWSPDGGMLVFLSSDEDASCSEVDVMRADGSGFRRLTPASTCSGGAAWSPDGRRIALSLGGEIVTVRPDGRGARVVARGGPSEGLDSPSWSPDGRTIYFAAQINGLNQTDLYTIAPNGRGLHRLTHDLAFELDPAWSPDGRRIAFVRSADELKGYAVAVMNADGRSARIVHRCVFTCRSPTWSPDGDRIAFAEGDTKTRVKIVSAAGGRAHTIAVGDHPSWSRSSGLIAYDLGAIYVAGPSGAHKRVAADPRPNDSYSNPAWSPDGRTLVFVNTYDCASHGCTAYELLLVTLGGRPRRLPVDDASADTPTWSPDGTRFVYATDSGLAIVQRSGRGRRIIFDGPGSQSGPDWKP